MQPAKANECAGFYVFEKGQVGSYVTWKSSDLGHGIKDMAIGDLNDDSKTDMGEVRGLDFG